MAEWMEMVTCSQKGARVPGRAHSENFQFELRRGFLPKRPGAVRLLAYTHSANMGIYSQAIAQFDEGLVPRPDITNHPWRITRKYGFGANLEQSFAPNLTARNFFKAAAHKWDFDGAPYDIDLGKHTEVLWKFVKDGVQLPPDIVIRLAIASTPPKFLGCFPPVQMNDTECVKYKFYISGILYTSCLAVRSRLLLRRVV